MEIQQIVLLNVTEDKKTAGDIAAELKLSKASVGGALRRLWRGGVIKRDAEKIGNSFQYVSKQCALKL